MARVLLVDDDPVVVELVRFRLRKEGHRVLTAASGEEALGVVAERGRPEVVVLDVSMPHMDGLELLGALRAQDGLADVPAIFLSGRLDPADVEAGRALGATYLTKPFVANALLRAIERALEPVGPSDDGGW